MKLKIDSNWIFAVMLLILIGVCVSNNQDVQTTRTTSDHLSIMSGNSGGTYYYIAAGQAKILSEKLDGINVTTQSTSGSPVENMTLVNQNSANLGLVTISDSFKRSQSDSDWTYSIFIWTVFRRAGSRKLLGYGWKENFSSSGGIYNLLYGPRSCGKLRLYRREQYNYPNEFQ